MLGMPQGPLAHGPQAEPGTTLAHRYVLSGEGPASHSSAGINILSPSHRGKLPVPGAGRDACARGDVPCTSAATECSNGWFGNIPGCTVDTLLNQKEIFKKP